MRTLMLLSLLRSSRALLARHRSARQTALRASSGDAPKKQVLVPIADGSEEIETTCITDTLVRAGAEVTVASVEDTVIVEMSRGLRVVADLRVDDLAPLDWDLVVCPGGMPGAERLRDSEPLDAILRAQAARAAPLAAVCASPAVILKPKGLLGGKATCYPAPPFLEALGEVTPGDVIRDGHVTTSRGPGTSLVFALSLVEQLYGPEKAAELKEQMLVS
mmetsp:Transcript_15449/g.46129  ORF Transcript_15449/g.46129 Transcript_15449/m.46129 type:complete len:219 (+) Transcript_15449:134-790(+)